MVILDVQVLTLPLTSVTVRVTVLVTLKLEQLKLLGVTARLAIPQASEEPLSISPAVIEAFPLPSRWTVRF